MEIQQKYWFGQKNHRVEISEEKEKYQGKGGKFWRNNYENFLKLQKKKNHTKA